MPVAHEKQSEEYIDPEEPGSRSNHSTSLCGFRNTPLTGSKDKPAPLGNGCSRLSIWEVVVRRIQTGSFMPNLELEYYFARRWSLAFSALYADFSYGGGKENKWGLSDVMLASRFWPLGEATGYNWLSVGFYGMYGDFDVRGDKIGDEGVRSYRKVLVCRSVCRLSGAPGSRFCGGDGGGGRLPFGVWQVKNTANDGIDGKNYLESRFTSTGVRLE